jgi:hypothetical protein
MLAIALCQDISGRRLDYTLRLDYTVSEQAHIGDRRWRITDLNAFKRDSPDWSMSYDIDAVLREIHDSNVERWLAVPRPESRTSSFSPRPCGAR